MAEQGAASSDTGANQATGSSGGGTPARVGEYDFTVDPGIGELGDDELRYLSETLRNLIAHRIDGIAYAEGKRGQLAALAGATAAVGVALLPVAGTVAWTPLRAVYLELSLAFLVIGAATWITYSRQTSYNYPFNDELSTWKWYYHQALPDPKQFGPGLVRHHGRARQAYEDRQYGEQWRLFAQQAIGLSDPRVDATQDLKQLYELHVNERYKNLFLAQLRRLLLAGFVLAAVGAVVTFIVAMAVRG